MSTRILVAEDDRKQAELIRRYLERDGHTAILVHDGREALEEIGRRRPDLLVLDVMMPRVDGLDVCRVIRTGDRGRRDLPIVFLTARSTEDDLLLGLDLGADDYLAKPYSPRELAARVRAVLRRAGRLRATGPLRVGRLIVDQVRHEVWIGDRRVEPTPAEFAILSGLAEWQGRAFTRHQLLEHAFGFEHDALERTIDVHVMNLRRKIEIDPADPRYLRTVYGIGYKLVEPETGSKVDHDDAS